jgi:hypothetical protein
MRLLGCFICLGGLAAASDRIATISAAAHAVSSAPPEQRRQVEEMVRSFDQRGCSSSIEQLRIDCLVARAREFCQSQRDGSACRKLFDVVTANLLAENYFISHERRFELLRDGSDPRRLIDAEVRRGRGALALDFRLRMKDLSAANIDRYCRATADENGLPWQACVSTLVWFTDGALK